jgi:hypothetical protein
MVLFILNIKENMMLGFSNFFQKLITELSIIFSILKQIRSQ